MVAVNNHTWETDMRSFLIPAVAVLAASCAAAPTAMAEPSQTPRTLSVTGQGEAKAAPDMAIVTIGVQSDGNTAADALRANSAAMKATIDKLKSMDIEARDIQTSGLNVNPRYNYENNRREPEVIGFRASNSVRVRLRDLDKAGEVVDEAVSSGANSLGGISFSFAEPKPLYDAARRDAVADARSRAELLADAAGVDLGPILTIQDGYVASPRYQDTIMVTASRAEADFSAPIEAGESSIRANVTLIYEIN